MPYIPDNKFDKNGNNFPRKRIRKIDEERFYNSKRWRRTSKRQLWLNPLCVVCGDLAQHTDHIIPFQQGGSKFDPENLQSLCISCHAKKTNKDSKYYS